MHPRFAEPVCSCARAVGGAAAVVLAMSCREPAGHAGDAAAAAASTATFDAQRVLARVGDRTITLGEFAAALDHMDEFDRLRYQAPERRKELLDEMIDVQLLADEARDRGYDREPEAEDQIREILRDAMLKKAREGAPAPDAIPKETVRAYFEAHRSDFHDPERRRVSAVVLPTEAAAQRVLDAALAADAGTWGELVRAHSVEPSASDVVPADLAGDLGFVSPPGDPRGNDPRVPPEVRSAVFEAGKVGDVVPRIVAAKGLYYVVKLESKSDAHDRTFDDAERSIRVKLSHDAARARQDALLDQLRKQIPVQLDEAALAAVRVSASDASP